MNDENGYRELGVYTPNVFVDGFGNTNVTVSYSPPVVDAPATFDIGQDISGSTTVSVIYEGLGTVSGPATYSHRAIGFEYITVPAGTFYAIRLESSASMTLATINITGSITTWVAENVGTVKRVTNRDDGTNVSKELLQYSLSHPISTTTTTTSATTTTTIVSTTTTLPSEQQGGINLGIGWNLVGNSNFATIDVPATFGDSTLVNTVWKWNSSSGKWAFYTPTQSDGGSAYAATKGYEALTTINGAEGFWVNAIQSFSRPVTDGTPVPALFFQDLALSDALKSGWNLISIGDIRTPSDFNAGLVSTPPVPGFVQNNLTTLWAWDNTSSQWYFYAPSLEAQGGTALTDYIVSKGYLDFTAANKTLGPGVGFWVNKP